VSRQGVQKAPILPDAGKVAEGGRLYHSVGCVQCHAPFTAPVGREAELAQVAAQSVPLAGPGIGKKYSLAELAAFLKDPLKSRPGGRMPSMNLTAEEAESIAAFLLREQKEAVVEPFVVDHAKAVAGGDYFVTLQCANCHVGAVGYSSVVIPAPVGKKFELLRPRQMSGCLAARPKGNAAKYELTDRQKTVILAALKSQEILGLELTPEQQVRRKMTALNCFACHSRDRRGGIAGLHLEYLADRDKLPPKLSGVGTSLAPESIQEILATGKKTRPEMLLRMPVFGHENTKDLPALFLKADAPAK
jgi:cytochrome c2